MKKGFCAGSFDPPTRGHADLFARAAKLCEQLTIGVAVNRSKQSMFSLEERKSMVEAAVFGLDNVDVIAFDGHLAMFAAEKGYECIFRGLRNRNDFDYELQLAQIYAGYPDCSLETVYLMTSPEYSYISSTVVRENYSLGADVSCMVPGRVLQLMDRYSKK